MRRNSILEPVRYTPVARKTDVIIVGGGPSGACAAIASARNGADTLLVERYGFLGGMMTAGLVNCLNGFRNQGKPAPQAISGIAQEVAERMKEAGGAYVPEGGVPYCVVFEPETAKLVLSEMAEESGVNVLLHTVATNPIKETGSASGVVVHNKSGRTAFTGDVVVDCTGDGDIAAACGAAYEVGREEDGATLPAQMLIRMRGVDAVRLGSWIQGEKEGVSALYDIEPLDTIREASEEGKPFGVSGLSIGGDQDRSVSCVVWRDWSLLWATEPQSIDCTEGQEISEAEMSTRTGIRELAGRMKGIPGFEESVLEQSATQIGVRETRRIVGEYVIDESDVLEGARFDDSIAVGANPMACLGRRILLGHGGFEIPFRALLPRELEGLILAGRCISTTHEAHGSIRAMATCMATGEAAGTAAALCVEDGLIPRHLGMPKLRERLEGQGALIDGSD